MFFPQIQPGIIALDIDGTITTEHHSIEKEVIDFFTFLNQRGWRFIFITGRTFSWGYSVLRHLPFHYYFAVQNGAIILEMPTQVIVSKKYLTKSCIPIMEAICKDEPSDFVIYTGFENRDLCYYRASHFEKKLRGYLQKRAEALRETWIDLPSFNDLPVDEFPSLKSFGEVNSISRIASRIVDRLGLHVPAIRDPFNDQSYVAQATHPGADKGNALREFKKICSNRGVVIAAGDDINDLPMLQNADIKVVMETAPELLRNIADIAAPAAVKKGIIQGLKHAIEAAGKVRNNGNE